MKLKSRAGGRPNRANASNYAPVLPTESLEEFESLVATLDLEVRGRNTIEVFYIEQVVRTMWEMRRYQPWKETILNKAMRPALETLLTQLQEGRQTNYDPKDLARDWFTNKEAKQMVSKILEEVGLDESAIAMEAWKMVSSELQLLELMVSSADSRLRDALRMIAQFGHVFSRKGMANLEDIHEEASVRRLNRR